MLILYGAACSKNMCKGCGAATLDELIGDGEVFPSGSCQALHIKFCSFAIICTQTYVHVTDVQHTHTSSVIVVTHFTESTSFSFDTERRFHS